MTKEINDMLEEHEKRITALESLFKTKRSNVSNVTKKASLTDHILELRNSGFFKEPQTAKETHEKLKSNYPCELNRVEVALWNLAKRKELRIVSKSISGKQYKAYAW